MSLVIGERKNIETVATKYPFIISEMGKTAIIVQII